MIVFYRILNVIRANSINTFFNYWIFKNSLRLEYRSQNFANSFFPLEKRINFYTLHYDFCIAKSIEEIKKPLVKYCLTN